jgi:hypothetical protein
MTLRPTSGARLAPTTSTPSRRPLRLRVQVIHALQPLTPGRRTRLETGAVDRLAVKGARTSALLRLPRGRTDHRDSLPRRPYRVEPYEPLGRPAGDLVRPRIGRDQRGAVQPRPVTGGRIILRELPRQRRARRLRADTPGRSRTCAHGLGNHCSSAELRGRKRGSVSRPPANGPVERRRVYVPTAPSTESLGGRRSAKDAYAANARQQPQMSREA